MNIVFRIDQALWRTVHRDLNRAHDFAHERVGFVICRPAVLDDGFLLLASEYHPVRDEDYEDVRGYGAMMGPGAIRMGLQIAYSNKVSIMHVHRHEHDGKPGFSRTDIKENGKFVPDFFKVRPQVPHGALLLSQDALAGEVWEPATMRRRPVDELCVVGRPSKLWWANE